MRAAIACCLALALAACGVTRPEAEHQSFLAHPEHPAPTTATPLAISLRVAKVSIARPFDGRAFVYRRDDVRYETDFYNEFAADPEDMVADAAAAWFRRSGLFREVFAPRAGAFADYRLDAGVSAMYVDFRNKPAAVVLAMRWRLRREGDDTTALEVDCEERVELGESSPHGAALAYGEALGRALAKLETALSRAAL